MKRVGEVTANPEQEESLIDRKSDAITIAAGMTTSLAELRLTKERLNSAESRLIHVSRHNAMGTMASIIAHELNQPLAAIANYVRAGRHMIAEHSPIDLAKLREVMKGAEENALRAGQIVWRLGELVKQDRIERKAAAVSDLIDDACTLALVDAESAGVDYQIQISPDVAMVMVDSIQIEQVIINLVRNAVDALESCQNRTIRITAAAKGKFVEIAVADNGIGITDDLRAALFSTLTSTKTSGMGIGLSICRTIVEAHGGKIWLAGTSTGGTDFRFTLPAVAAAASPA